MAGTPGRKLDLKARLGCIIFVMCSAGGGLTGVGRVYAQSLSWDTNPVNYTLSTHITAMGQQITGTTSVGLTRNNTSASCFSHGTGGEPRPLSFNGVDGNPSLTTEYEMQCADLTPGGGDTSWVAATTFLPLGQPHYPNGGYGLSQSSTHETLTLQIRATAPTGSILPAGTYQAHVYYEADWGSGNQNHVPLYITAYVDSFAQWDTTTQTIATADFSGHITAVNQSQTASKTFHLYSNTACSIKATAASGSPDNNGILTGPTSATLTTAYMLTGSGLSSPDGSWKAAGTNGGQFFSSSNSYSINYSSAVSDYPVTLQAQATSGASAPPSGSYTCRLTLTASW